jgi:glycolate oxidase FAD binding subunit
VLASRGQYLPLDPPFADRATVGGIVATNDSGPIRHRYGTPRDLLIGATLVAADGVVVRSGGRVVKNVAGYDLARLAAGSHGTLCAIATVTFKLSPLPSTWATAVVTGTPEQLAAVAQSLVDRQLEPVALEIVSRPDADGPWSLVARFGSDRSTVESHLGETMTIARTAGAACESAWDAGASRAWHAAIDRVWAHRVVVRVSWLPANVEGALSSVTRDLEDCHWALTGRMGIGAAHIGLDGDVTVVAAAVERLRGASALGHVTIVQGPAALRSRVDPWPALPSGAAAVASALKHAWDPQSILGAGRGPL